MMKVRLLRFAPWIIATLVVMLGMIGTIVPNLLKPADRVFTGLNGYSDDYIGYVSYIKEGMYGKWTFSIRSLPPPQTPTSANLTYIVLGKLAALTRMDAPSAYHVGRVFLGLTLVLTSYRLFILLLEKRSSALIATILAFWVSSVGWFERTVNGWHYRALSSFGFTDNVVGRATSRPHYTVGAILFISIVMFLIRPSVLPVAIIGVSVASFILGITHPSFGVLLIGIVAVSCLMEYISTRRIREIVKKQLPVLIGLGIGLVVSYWSVHQYPYTAILSFESYVATEKLSLSRIWADVVAFGPMLWIGLPGLLAAIVYSRHRKVQYLMFFWLFTQLLLFFVLYPLFRAERFRFIQSLYFLPMVYGTVYLLGRFEERIKKPILIVGSIVLIVATTASYVDGMRQSIFSWTEYKDFSIMPFPPLTQMEAYAFLNSKTPQESTVLASWEASNHILIYSHNYVVGNTQGWNKKDGDAMTAARDRFLTGSMNSADAASYLRAANISYIYYGYQERSLGSITQYPFLAKVFQNKEVEIYEVRL